VSPPAPLPYGVTAPIERSIERGIRLLFESQRSDGSWDAASEYGRDYYRVAVTGLCGLALLAHGDTPTRGIYADNVMRATEYLIKASTAVGLICGPGDVDGRDRQSDERTMYGHAFAMTFLAQVLGLEGDLQRREQIRDVLHRAIQLTRRSQTDAGGWAYFPNYYYDEGTLTVTQLQGLRACRDAGLLVSKDIVDGGMRFIDASANPNGSVRYRVDDRRWRPGVTCAAVIALWNAGDYDSPLIRRTIDFMNLNIRHDFFNGHHAEYVEYYLAQAKWVLGGTVWRDYYRTAAPNLVRMQQSDGHWEGADAGEYGAMFGTAIALIILQLPYDRLPVYQR
jgi:hypothetical protein